MLGSVSPQQCGEEAEREASQEGVDLAIFEMGAHTGCSI
jgi:hypothetical protein